MARSYRRLTKVEQTPRPILDPKHDVLIDARVTKLVKPDAYWIEVDRAEQVLYLYRNTEIIKAWRVSTGKPPNRVTRPGVYKVYSLYEKYPMWGIEDKNTGWWCPDVPFAMFFHGELAIHGAYWHNDFGTPVSHGCVNMMPDDAAELYRFVGKGTVVWVHA